MSVVRSPLPVSTIWNWCSWCSWINCLVQVSSRIDARESPIRQLDFNSSHSIHCAATRFGPWPSRIKGFWILFRRRQTMPLPLPWRTEGGGGGGRDSARPISELRFEITTSRMRRRSASHCTATFYFLYLQVLVNGEGHLYPLNPWAFGRIPLMGDR